MWVFREKLNYFEKMRRSLYEILRDSLEKRLMKISLIDSFYNYQSKHVYYNFLEKSELKPKAKRIDRESGLFNTFIVIFCEGAISTDLKNYIRFFPENKLIKKNLQYLPDFTLYKKFHKNLRYFDNLPFLDFLEELLKIDYALLIQPDPTSKKKNHYALTHFHVKIDWPIADAAEDLAKYLRYIQNNLYEQGDNLARLLQNKLFEYYACHHSAGGRRTAALIAAQLLRKENFISTVFVSSSESRSMIKYSERGVSKFFLIQLSYKESEALAYQEQMNPETFRDCYLYPADGFHIGVSEAVFGYTIHAKSPEDGKYRRLKPAYSWLKLKDEFLHPKNTWPTLRPINYNWVYSSESRP